MRAVPIWLGTANRPGAEQTLGWTCSFPPAWQHLCMFNNYERSVWNEDHPLVHQADAAALEWLSIAGANPHEMALAEPFRQDLLKSPTRAAAWLARMLSDRSAQAWRALTEQHGKFFEALLSSVFGDRQASLSRRSPSLVRLSQGSGNSELHILTPDGWNVEAIEDRPLGGKRHPLFPDPGPEWTMQVIRRDSEIMPPRKASKGASKKKTKAKPGAARAAKKKPGAKRKKAKRSPKSGKR